MWHLIIRNHSGQYIREKLRDEPTNYEIDYYEHHHSEHVDMHSSYMAKAVVVNIYFTKTE